MSYIRSLIEILNHPCNKGSKLTAFARIIWWKLNQLLFHMPAVVQMTHEAKCLCYPESSYGGMVVYTRFPEYHDMNFIYKMVRPGDIFFDIGASIGTYSLIAASKISSGKVYAFEPTASSLNILNQNILLNNFEAKIEVVAKVASDIDGYEFFALCKDSEENHICYSAGKREGGELEIASVRLDTFVSECRLSYVDIVKIDVEGAEYKVLQGLEAYLTCGKVGTLLIELNPNSRLFGVRPSDIFQFLGIRGYAMYHFEGDNGLCLISTEGFRLSAPENIVAVHESFSLQDRIEGFRKVRQRQNVLI